MLKKPREWIAVMGGVGVPSILAGLGILALNTTQANHAYGYGLIAFGVTTCVICGMVAFYLEQQPKARVLPTQGVVPPVAGPSDPAGQVTISPDDDGEWAWLRVDNNDKAGVFIVSVELLETGEKEHAYHAPWRDNNVESLEIVKGDHRKANIAWIAADAATNTKAAVRFFSKSNSDGYFQKAFEIGSHVRCRIKVFRKDEGPVTLPREYVLHIEARDRLHFFERGSYASTVSTSGADSVGKEPPTGTYVGEGIWDEVKWKGRRLASGRIDAGGPLCIDDDTLLLYRTFTPDGSPIEDYHEVNPPESHLYCPLCGKKYYLGATERKARRIGDARRNAAWRLGGGMTPYEKHLKNVGLL